MSVVETILVQGRERRVSLVAETEVKRGRVVGATRREYVDDDGALHVRYDDERLAEPALVALRERQSTPEARALADALSPEARERVRATPSGTVQRVLGVAWARRGSVYLVGPGCVPVPRALLGAAQVRRS